jgi:hypothetical protein
LFAAETTIAEYHAFSGAHTHPPSLAPPFHSPSRHICHSLTIAGAFPEKVAFDAGGQRLIKVDGTFA